MRNVLTEWRRKDSRPPNTLSIPWNVQEIGAQAAWKEENATGQGVKVAVIDTGIISTPSLIHALVKNPGEELNGLDDDKNGLIDDLFGYDFIADNGHIIDVAKTTSHGSSCVGIIAGRPSRLGLQTAIAPDSKIMLLKGGFNLRSLEYLMSNGADIVSMSFMIVNRDLGQIRGLFRNAFEHLSLGGVLAVGGAGNYGPQSPRAMPVGKQIGLPKDIPCVLAIAGVDRSRINYLSVVKVLVTGKESIFFLIIQNKNLYRSPTSPHSRPAIRYGMYPVHIKSETTGKRWKGTRVVH